MAAGVLLIVLILGTATISTLWLRDLALHDAETRMSQLTVMVAEQVERALESVDGVMQVTVDRIAQADLGDLEARASIHTYLNQQAFNLPQARNFIVYDQNGDRVVDSQSATPQPQNSSEGEHYRYYHEHPEARVHLSVPTRSRQTGDWYFSLSRRLVTSNGSFAGLAVASVDYSYFTDVFKSAMLDDSASISFVRRDGIRLFRYPVVESAFGDSFTNTELFKRHLSGAKAGVIRVVSRLSGKEQLSSFRPLKNFPVFIIVSDQVDDILSPWQVQAWVIAAVSAVVLAVFCVIGATLIRQARRGDSLLAEAQDARHSAELATKAAERASRAKSEFLAGVSHDLRTPLNSIIGFSEVLLASPSGSLSEQQREYTQYINTAGTHLLSLINTLLDLAKIEANRLTIVDDKFALHGVINECMRLVSTQAEAGRVTLVPYDTRRFGLRADPVRLRQIIFNLLSNAIKFTPPGGKVEIRSDLAEDGSLTIAVSDTGIGMSEQDIATAMQPYGQVENKLIRQHEGTGLGLPLVHALTELHGGSVKISSIPGKGTTVSVNLRGDRVLLIDGETRAA